MKRTQIRMSRIFAAMASVVIVIFITDGAVSSLFIKDTEACIENIGRFPEKKIEGGTITISNDAATEPSTADMKVTDAGYGTTQISAEVISQGYLAPATDSNPIQTKNDIV